MVFPRSFWVFLIGVFLFGLGDFSRTFLIWLALPHLETSFGSPSESIALGALLYALHNLVSGAVAYPIGRFGDRRSPFIILLGGYGLGVGANLLLALGSGSLNWLVVAMVCSGVYIAVEETLEKAVAAELLPRDLRSLGFGYLAFANAIGDMGSSLYVGLLLEAGFPVWAFGLASAFGLIGVLWLGLSKLSKQFSRHPTAG